MFFYRVYALRIISRESTHKRKTISVTVPKGIFHPGLFFSTNFLIEELERMSLTGKSFLELGCGSGIISIVAAQNGAITTSVDINDKAVLITQANARNNKAEIEVIQSDLFSGLAQRLFDIIAINPPYYKKNPANYSDAAWYAGENFEYFQKLFSQIEQHTHSNSIVLMVVSEDVYWKDLVNLAASYHITFSLVREKVVCFEKNFIYRLSFDSKLQRL